MTRHLAFLAVVITVGLSLRAFGLAAGLPASVVKYGGSVLWATMVYLLVSLVSPNLMHRSHAQIAMTIAICVEMFRLCHSPWLDQFRLTLFGALLLGRIFSLWNIVAYAFGIALALAVDPGRERNKSIQSL